MILLSAKMRRLWIALTLVTLCACDDGSGQAHHDAGTPLTDAPLFFIDGARDLAATDLRGSDGPTLETAPSVDMTAGDTRIMDTGNGDVQLHDAALPDASIGPFCLECVQIRVGRPLIARGPAADELDTSFSVMPLSGGGWRGFSANGTTYAVDGPEPWSMGGARTPVLTPGPAGSDSECGQWINDVKSAGVGHLAFVHWERSCNYVLGETHKSMAYAVSSDEGMSWNVMGKIIGGTDAPTAGIHTGEGDCSVVEGGDGYYYIYCLRVSDYQTIVARAPVSDPGPGMWLKYFQGTWSQPGVGGQAESLGFIGPAAGRWTSQDQILTLVPDKWSDGLKLSFARDKVSFVSLAEPLIHLDDVNWARPAPTELIAYVSLLNPATGSKQLDGTFFLAYSYIQPGEDFSQRYLVFREVWMHHGTVSSQPQVGVALSRWHNAALNDRWSTTAPVPGNFDSYLFEGTFGYLMTKPHPTLPTTKLEDCVSSWPGHPDHLLTRDGDCVTEGYTRLRTAGWVFADEQPETVPLYRCYSKASKHHFASNAVDCEGLGTMEWLLGHALAQ